MIKLEEYKQATAGRPIERMPLSPCVYIPLSQHLGKICVPQVKAGDLVARGQRIASVEARISSVVHASLSGKVVSIREWPHPVLGRSEAIVIESDGLDKGAVEEPSPQAEIGGLSPQEIRRIVFEAGIVGMGGASFPAHIKLAPPKAVDTLIINGAECEPYLSGDYRLMVEKTGEILKGIEIIKRCLAVKNVYIAIEDNKPEAIKAFRELFNREPRTENREPIKLVVLKSEYPQGGEKQLIKNILKKEVPSGKLPFDIGAVVHNVGTVFAIYEAVYLGKPLYERVVTVTGACLSSPKNLWVRIGTPIRELIDFCGPLKEEPAKIIIGGPMMGIAQYTDAVPVIKSTTGIILFNEREARMQEESPCIRCGACVRNCPAGLMPCLLNLSAEKERWQEALKYNAADCIECGLCNYTCPANRMLTQSIKRAKLELNK